MLLALSCRSTDHTDTRTGESLAGAGAGAGPQSTAAATAAAKTPTPAKVTLESGLAAKPGVAILPAPTALAPATAISAMTTRSAVSVQALSVSNAKAAVTPAAAPVLPTSAVGPGRYLQGNFTGTGRTSLASILPDGTIWVGTSDDSTMTWAQWSNIPAWGGVYSPSSPARFAVGDFDGDGKDDLLFAWPDGTVWVGRSTGSGFQFALWASIPAWGPIWNAASPARTFVADFTGDGKADFAFTWVDGTVWVGVSNGSSFTFQNFANIPAWSGVFVATSPGRFFAGDFTGGGKADLAFAWPDGSIWVGVSNGKALQFKEFAYIPGWGPIWTAGSASRITAADFNGDGKQDLLFTWVDGSWWIGMSTGTAFNFQVAAGIPAWGPVTQATSAARTFVADFNGDGKADFFFTWPYDSSWWIGLFDGKVLNFKQWLNTPSWSAQLLPTSGASVFVGNFSGQKSADVLLRDNQGELFLAKAAGDHFAAPASLGNWLPVVAAGTQVPTSPYAGNCASPSRSPSCSGVQVSGACAFKTKGRTIPGYCAYYNYPDSGSDCVCYAGNRGTSGACRQSCGSGSCVLGQCVGP